MWRSRTRGLAAAVAVGLLAATPAMAQVTTPEEIEYPPLPEVTIPTPERIELPNGLVLMVLEDSELPLVHASARIRTGALLQPPDKVGLASVTGAMLRAGGTDALGPDELDELLEGKAASVETGIGADSGSASASALKEDFPEVLQVLADVLRRPAFDEGRLQVQLTQQRTGVARQNDDPGSILAREFTEVIHGEESPYAAVPTYATIANITRDDLVAWHKQYYHPNRVILGVWGDITVDEATALVEKTFGDWAEGPEVPPFDREFPAPADDPRPGVYQAIKKDVNQSSIRIGHQGSLRSDHPDYFAVEVLNELFGGSFASRLFSNVRSAKGLAYSVSGAVNSSFARVQPFAMSMTTRTETTGAGISALLEEAEAIRETRVPTEAEVARAQEAILASFVFNFATVGQILNRQLDFEYRGVALDWLDHYRDEIEAVTTAEVQAVAEKYIHPDRFSIVVVGTGDGYDEALDAFGTLTALDISIPPPPESTAPAPSAGATAGAAAEGTGEATGEETEETAQAGEEAAKAEGAEEAKAPVSPAALMAANAMLDKATDAVGGLQKLRELKAYQQRATVVVPGPQGQQMSMTVQSTFALPDRMHMELNGPMGTVAMVVTPDEAFRATPEGVTPLGEEERARLEAEAWHDPLLILVARGRPGFQAVRTGTDKVAETDVQVVEVTRRRGSGEDAVELPTVTLGIDGATGRILTMSFRGTGPTGVPATIEQRFDDFQTVDGFTVPHAVTSTVDGQPGPSMTIDAVAFNPPIDPALFAKPEG